MKISAKARYGLRILLDIALHETPERPRLMKEICASQRLSEKFTSRLVIPLRQAGMIHALRGKSGGFRLAKATSDITPLDVIETLQGPISLVDCVQQPKICPKGKACAARSVWLDVNMAVRAALAGVTLEKVLVRTQEMGCDIPASLTAYSI